MNLPGQLELDVKPANQRKKSDLENNTEIKDGTVLNTKPVRNLPLPDTKDKEGWRASLGANNTTPKTKTNLKSGDNDSQSTYKHLAEQQTIGARNLKEVIGDNVAVKTSKNKKQK